MLGLFSVGYFMPRTGTVQQVLGAFCRGVMSEMAALSLDDE